MYKEKNFAGTLKTRHKSSGKMDRFEDLTKFSPLNRYDGGNAVHGTDVTYLDAIGSFTNPGEKSMYGQIAGDTLYDVDANFKNALVITPETKLPKDYGDLVEYAKSKGHDGVILEGFSDLDTVIHDKYSDKDLKIFDPEFGEFGQLGAHERLNPENFQDQVLSFEPHNQAKIVGEVPHNYTTEDVINWKGEKETWKYFEPSTSKLPHRVTDFNESRAERMLKKEILKQRSKNLGKKVAKKLPVVGVATSAAMMDDLTDIFGAEVMDTDRTIEDPTSLEYMARMNRQRLKNAQRLRAMDKD